MVLCPPDQPSKKAGWGLEGVDQKAQGPPLGVRSGRARAHGPRRQAWATPRRREAIVSFYQPAPRWCLLPLSANAPSVLGGELRLPEAARGVDGPGHSSGPVPAPRGSRKVFFFPPFSNSAQSTQELSVLGGGLRLPEAARGVDGPGHPSGPAPAPGGPGSFFFPNSAQST